MSNCAVGEPAAAVANERATDSVLYEGAADCSSSLIDQSKPIVMDGRMDLAATCHSSVTDRGRWWRSV